MIFPRETTYLAPQCDSYIAQCTIIHIENTCPRNLTQIDLELITLVDVIINHSGQQIICRCNGVHITGKMKINIIHWYYLRITATSSAALDTEYRSQGWFAKCSNSILADFIQGLHQTDGSCRFPFPCRSWCNSRNEN